MSSGRFRSWWGPGGVLANNLTATTMYSDSPAMLGLVDGTLAQPVATDNDPVLWAQKYSQYDNGTDRFAHNIGGVFGQIYTVGSGVPGAVDIDGSWVGVLGSAILGGVNQGTALAPDFDAYGNTIGVAGFAKSKGYPGSGNIVCGLWGYAEGPTLDATTHANLPATNWTLTAVEANIQVNHPDIGEQSVLVGKGSSVYILANNYRTPGTGVLDATFGMVLAGTPNDNNFASTDITNWSGFYTGLLIDKIKAKGIRFGQYFAANSYGLWFPDSYAGATEPAAAMYLGNNKLNLGQYVGATFNNQDFWHNGGYLFWKYGGTTERVVTERSSQVRFSGAMSLLFNGTTRIDVGTGGGVALCGAFGSESMRAVAVASAVNRTEVYGAATGGAVVYAANGTDADVPIEYRSRGVGRHFWTINSVEVASLTTTGVSFTGFLRSTGATSGIGYATGAGGTVAQITNKATGVTLNKVCGQITMNAAALAGGAKVSFVVTNNTVAAADLPDVVIASGGTANAYRANVTAVAAGSFTVTVENITAGSLSEAPVLTFVVVKAVTA